MHHTFSRCWAWGFPETGTPDGGVFLDPLSAVALAETDLCDGDFFMAWVCGSSRGWRCRRKGRRFGMANVRETIREIEGRLMTHETNMDGDDGRTTRGDNATSRITSQNSEWMRCMGKTLRLHTLLFPFPFFHSFACTSLHLPIYPSHHLHFRPSVTQTYLIYSLIQPIPRFSFREYTYILPSMVESFLFLLPLLTYQRKLTCTTSCSFCYFYNVFMYLLLY